MSDSSGEKNSETSEDLPTVSLKQEDKVRVIKGMILLLLFSSIIIFSLIYCNAPNYNANILFTSDHLEKRFENYQALPLYQVDSRLVRGNRIELNLSLIRELDESYPKINVLFIFSQNSVNVTIKDNNINSNNFIIPIDLLDSSTISLVKEGPIRNVDESSIGYHIDTFPFGFRLYRKETNETFFDTISSSKDSNTFLNYKNSILRKGSSFKYNSTSLKEMDSGF